MGKSLASITKKKSGNKVLPMYVWHLLTSYPAIENAFRTILG